MSHSFIGYFCYKNVGADSWPLELGIIRWRLDRYILSTTLQDPPPHLALCRMLDPTNAFMCTSMWIKSLTAMMVVKYSAGVTLEVNLRNPLYKALKHASKGSTLTLKPSSDINRSSKQWYQWPHKTLISSKIKKKECVDIIWYVIR